MRLVAENDSVRLGPFRFAYDPSAGTLAGLMPRGLVPVYSMPIRLRRVDRFDAPPRPPLAGRPAEPRWTFEAGSPLWAGPTFDAGRLYVGAQDGSVFALDARSGARRWVYKAGGPIRTRPIVARGTVLLQADDGMLYALSAHDGRLEWRVKIVERPIERLPFDNPKSRYDRFGSDVTVAGGRLYVGTHDGTVLALSASDGRRLWEFRAGDAVLAAPAVEDGRVLFGSYDHSVYALDARTGRLLWKRDTQGAVVSTPAVVGGHVVVGNRCYDLLGLDARTGDVAWKRYVWSSWVESSAAVRDGVAYVGSSDAAAVFAVDARTGAPRWTTDVHGWAWGQCAVTRDRVYAGTSGQVGYPVPHHGGLLALDRRTGAVAWHFATTPPDSGAFGFPGSPAVGMGLVFASGLDGRVYAFDL
jgi:outer membrane protein assembly factor BamB